MKKTMMVVVFLTNCLCSNIGNAKEKIIEGVILRFEYGDNCYLTIADVHGKPRGGLCAAPLCEIWNKNMDMPEKYKGKKVRIVVEKGTQYNGDGNAAGEMDAFVRIDLR